MKPNKFFKSLTKNTVLFLIIFLLVFSFSKPALAFNPGTVIVNFYDTYIKPLFFPTVITVVSPEVKTIVKPRIIKPTTPAPVTIINNSNAKVSDAQVFSALKRLLKDPEITAELRGPVGPSGSTQVFNNATPYPATYYYGSNNYPVSSSIFDTFNTNTANIASLNVSGDTKLAGNLNIAGAVTGGTYNLATISGGSLTSTSVNGVSTANILTTSSFVNPSQEIWGNNYTAWGDSLTAAGYPGILATISGTQIYNGGVGGNTSTQIAIRQGSVSTTATIVGGIIPASGGVTITFPTGYEPVTSQGPFGGTQGTISGVYGTVSLSNGIYTFTRTIPGSAVSVGSATLTVDTHNYNGGFVIIWVGRNNVNSTALSDIAAMVASLPSPKRYLILSVPNGDIASEVRGQSGYNTIINFNNSLASTYPNNYLDIRALMVSQYDPTNGVDVVNFNNDVPPSSLRGSTAYWTLPSDITSSQTAFNLSASTKIPSNGSIISIGSEAILVTATDLAGNVTNSIRGYDNTISSTHTANTLVFLMDYLHPGTKGNTYIAQQVYKWILAHDPGAGGSHPIVNTDINSIFASPPAIGSNFPNTGIFTQLYSGGMTVNSNNLIGTGTTNGYGLQVNAPTGATNNYSAIFQGGNVGIGTTAPNSLLSLKSTAGIESGTLGTDIATTATWTQNGWTGSYASGFTAPLSTAVLTAGLTIPNLGPSSLYAVSFTITGQTAGSFTITATNEALTSATAYSSNNTYTWGFRAVSAGADNLTFNPTATFNGTISNITVKTINYYGGTNSPTLNIIDNAGNSSFEIRSSLAQLNNTFVGKLSGLFNITGAYNTAIGVGALQSNITGISNTAVGYSALYKNTTGNQNIAIGINSLFANNQGVGNVALGYWAMLNNTTGNNNIAIGSSALSGNLSGYYNVAIGANAVGVATSSGNVGVGYGALASDTTGGNNVAVGGANNIYALGRITTGSNNIGIGSNAGMFIADGVTGNATSGNSVYLGYGTRAKANGGTNETVIGYSAIGNGSNTITLGNSSITGLYVGSNLASTSVGDYVCIDTTTHQLSQGTAVCSLSSERFKINIQNLTVTGLLAGSTSTQPTDLLAEVMALRPVSFQYKKGYGDNGDTTQLGFIAEEAVNVDPRLVIFDADKLPSGFNYPTYTAVLTGAIKEMNLNLDGIANTIIPIAGSPTETFVTAFFKNIEKKFTTWLADATNGVGDVFANVFNAKEKICIDNECLNKNDIHKLLLLVHTTSSTTTAPNPTPIFSTPTTTSHDKVSAPNPAPIFTTPTTTFNTPTTTTP